MVRFLQFLSVLVVFSVLADRAMPQNKNTHIDERRGQVMKDGTLVSLGERREFVERNWKLPTQGRDQNPWTYSFGAELTFDAQWAVESITLGEPFGGATFRKIRIGSNGGEVLQAYKELSTLQNGWNQGNGIAFEMHDVSSSNTGIVKRIRVSRQKVVAPPNVPDRRNPAEARPNPAPPSANNPPPQPKPNPPAVVNPPAEPQPIQDKILLMDQSVVANDRGLLLDAPVSGWPTTHGRLLVRVAYTSGLREAQMVLCESETVKLECEDEAYDADLLQRYSRGGRPLSWRFRFLGRGPVKVQIVWFKDRRGIREYVDNSPYNTTFAFRESPPPRPVADEPPIQIFEHSWRASPDLRWIKGPALDWPAAKGVLLVRARGSDDVREFLWRGPSGKVQRLPLGDHMLPADVLGRERDPLRRFFGGSAQNLSFAFLGYGWARVQVTWFPAESVLKRHCEKEPINTLSPWLHGRAESFGWRTLPEARFRDRLDHESDWRTVRFESIAGTWNVASPRYGATVFETSRDGVRSSGHEFDQGIWFSEPGRVASLTSYFFSPSVVHRICIPSLGAEGDAAEFILVELLDVSGRWRRVAGFSDENINWHRVGSTRNVCSRPPVTIEVDGLTPYCAVRFLMSGIGPFRASGLFVSGREVSPPTYQPPLPHPPTVNSLVVNARDGWIDTGTDVSEREEIFVGAQGVWTLSYRDQNPWPSIGAEGYSQYELRALLGERFYRGFAESAADPSSAPGSLIGRIGRRGRPFLVQPGACLTIPASGRLFLACNDSSYDDNDGSLSVAILGGRTAVTTRVDPSSNAWIEISGQVSSEISGRPLRGVDVILQEDSPLRVIYGGARTDSDGRFRARITVPAGRTYLLRIPEFKVEGQPRVPSADDRWEWNISIR